MFVGPDDIHFPHLRLLVEKAVLVIIEGDALLYHCLLHTLTLLFLLSYIHLEGIEVSSQANKF